MNNPQPHQPVLLELVLEFLEPAHGKSYLDLTAGYGGHAAAVIGQTGSPQATVLVDRDTEATSSLKERFKTATVLHLDYATAASQLLEQAQTFDMVLMDLGVSSPQLDQASRGFSFRLKGPLDMRMDQTQDMQAAQIVNQYSEKELADLIFHYGDERRSRQIAAAIVRARPFPGTIELAEAIRRTQRGYSRIHPATRTFQALRIAVNDELGQLEATLPLLPGLLNPGGRLAIISFHSLEDRLVKHWLRGNQDLDILTKKAVMGKQNDESNPRARSARMRAAIKKQKNKKEAKNYGH